MSVIVTNCPLEPSTVRYGAVARTSARNPCTTQPMQCLLCRDTVWLYGMAHDFDSKHGGSAPPSALCVDVHRKETAVNWSGKRNTSKRSYHEIDAVDEGDVAEAPPPRASTAPAPHSKRIKSSGSSSSSSSSFSSPSFSSSSSSEASSGAETSRPLQNVAKRNYMFSWQPKNRSATTAYDFDSSSSDGKLFK